MIAVEVRVSPAAPIVDIAPRCWRCKRLLANVAARPWDIDCGRCKALNASPPDPTA